MYKMMTAAAAALVMMTATVPAFAEEAAGDWAGVLGNNLKIALHLNKDANGRYEGHMKSIEQGNAIIALDSITATPDTLAFHGANKQLGVDGRYEGRWEDAKKQWTGQWIQGGSAELNFKRTGPAAIVAPKRPQEEAIAKGRLPYANEEVAFDNPAAPGVRLAGTFSKPKGKGPIHATKATTISRSWSWPMRLTAPASPRSVTTNAAWPNRAATTMPPRPSISPATPRPQPRF